VDGRLPDGGNCYRRALLAIALDAGAAQDPLVLGLDARGGPASGHAWLGERRGREEPYPVELVL
jgi:hypothetical protein